MKIYSEKSLRNFEFWSGAKEHATEILCDYLQSIDFTAFNDDDKKVLFELSEIIDL